ncbi:kinase-like domain-containing protein, partial [Daedaleopsis nitida]
DTGIIWLVEPRRSAIVDRWSGTLVQVHRENKRSATMAAFAHYSILASEYSLVFVDLQSSYGSLPYGLGDGHVLFDPMTHTISGESGVGDHGVDGLRRFIREHKCSVLCSQMDLERLS